MEGLDNRQLGDFMYSLLGMELADVRKVLQGVEAVADKKYKEEVSKFSKTLQPVHLPSYFMLTHTEIMFVEVCLQLFANYRTDYRAGKPNEISNDNSVNVVNSWNDVYEKKGQYPLVIVEATDSIPGKLYMANLNAKAHESTADTESGKYSVDLTIPVSITVVSPKKNEVNMLANLIQFIIIECQDELKTICGIYNFPVLPTVKGATLMREFGPLHAAPINFTTQRQVSWSDIRKIKHFKNLLLRFNARATSDRSENPITQIIGKFTYPLDPDVKELLRLLEKNYGG